MIQGLTLSPAGDILILLATRNGAHFLPQQLDSYSAQVAKNWHLIASDDGSTDDTARVLAQFAHTYPAQITLLHGPQSGPAANFLSMLRQAPDADFAAFSDQDDVWLPNKLGRATDLLGKVGGNIPAFYCGCVTVCDQNLRPLRQTAMPDRPLGFRNALVQNVAFGNTIVVNRAALALLREAAHRSHHSVMHDWWAYQIITGAGGQIVFDNESYVLYRQHGDNAVGAEHGLIKKLNALRRRSQWHWMRENLAVLANLSDLMTDENRALVSRLDAAHRAGPAAFSKACAQERLYRQGALGRIAPVAAALFGRL